MDSQAGISGRTQAAFTARLSAHFPVGTFDAHPETVFGLLPNYQISYVNSAWLRFAAENNGQPRIGASWGPGANYLDAIAAPLRPFFERLLARAADADGALHPVTHEYECSTPSLYRRFAMRVYGLPARGGFVIVNSLMLEQPHDESARPVHEPDLAVYTNADGLVVQCAHCRLVRQGKDPERWEWVPQWVESSPPATSHGVCGICLDYYYPVDA